MNYHALKSYDSIFSKELFGMGKKNANTQQTPPPIEEVRKLPKYNRALFEKCVKTFINAWNYKAYKLPNSLGKDHDGNEADEGVCLMIISNLSHILRMELQNITDWIILKKRENLTVGS